MATERTYPAKLGKLLRLSGSLAANSDELKDFEAIRLKLEAQVSQTQEKLTKQGALRAEKQETSRELKTLFAESERLANVLRKVLKAHYGIRSEKLTEFGLQPFRGLKAKPAEAPQPPAPAPESQTLTAK